MAKTSTMGGPTSAEEMLVDDLAEKEQELAERERAITQEAQRVERLSSQVEALAAKLDLAASSQPGEVAERRIASPIQKGSTKTFRVLTNSPDAHAKGFRSVVVEGCCDESEAVRCALVSYGFVDTHLIRCTVEAIAN